MARRARARRTANSAAERARRRRARPPAPRPPLPGPQPTDAPRSRSGPAEPGQRRARRRRAPAGRRRRRPRPPRRPLPALRREEPREPRRRRQTRTATAGSGGWPSSRLARRNLPAGPGSPPGRLRWSASRKAASSSVRPARRTFAAAALKARRWRQTPAQGGFSRTMASRRASAAPARKAASASVSGACDGPRPGRQRRRRGGRKALDCLRISAREHAETLRRDGAFA